MALGATMFVFEVRLADGLGGHGLVFFDGLVADVEAAVEIGTDTLAPAASAAASLLIHAVVIPQLHPDMADNLLADTHWRARVRLRRANPIDESHF